jgi:hypothetical protein
VRKLIVCASLVLVTLGIPARSSFAAAQTATIPKTECAKPNYKSGSYDGQHAYGSHYIVENDVWNPVSIKQQLSSCNFDSFFVEASVKDRGGAVQSYPSSQFTFARPIRISKFSSLISDFRFSNPPRGRGLDYEAAYDLWINGYGGNNHTEMMIWTYNDGQLPTGRTLRTPISIDGHMFKVWEGGTLSKGGDIVTFEAVKNYTSGRTNLRPFHQYAARQGWLHNDDAAALWQVDFGAELCATSGTTKFDFTDFNVKFKA